MACCGHDHVHVGVTGRVFGVLQIEQRRALHHTHRDGGHLAHDGSLRQLATGQQGADGIVGGDKCPGDGRSARTAIGLDHIAVKGNGALTQQLQVKHGPQRTANQPLDFLGTATLFALGRLAVAAGVGGTRQHAVFSGHPAFARTPLVRRHLFLHRCRTQHLGVAELDEHRSFCVHGVVAGDAHRPQLICGTTCRADKVSHEKTTSKNRGKKSEQLGGRSRVFALSACLRVRKISLCVRPNAGWLH